ncbi:MAG: trigger factor, partial [Azospirillum brasilense]
QITAKEKTGLTHNFHVIVPAKDVEAEMEVELQSLSAKVKMPGFRPGKVPMDMMKKKYGRDVLGDVLQSSINKATKEVIDQNKLRPAMQPDIKIVSFEEGQDLSFDISVDVLPELPAVDYSKLTVDEYTFEVPESETNESLERLAKSRRHPHKKDGAADNGDVVKIDFLGKRDGVPFAGGEGKGFQLELGSNQFIPGFEEQLIGLKAGDTKTIEVKFPEQYHSADLAGQPATFDVTVHEVSYLHTPDVSDKMAEGLGFENLEALKKAINSQLGAEFERAARTKSKKQLFDLLDKEVKLELPEKMQKAEFESIWKQVEEAKKAGDPELKDKSEAELKKEYEAIATRRVKLGILLSEVGRANNLQITREELSAAVMEQARMYPGQEEKVFEFYRKNPQGIDELRGPILEEKAVDYLLGQVKRKQVPTTIEALMGEEEEGEAAPAKKSAKK